MKKKNNSRRRRKKKNKILVTLIIMLLAIIVMMVIYQTSFTATQVNEKVKIEAGTKVLDISDFLKDKDKKDVAVIDADFEKIDLSKIGNYPVKIKVGSKEYDSNIEVVDTISPVIETKNGKCFVDETVTPEQFLSNIKDATNVTTTFKNKPDTSKEGEQTVILICTDEGGNKTEAKASLTVETKIKDTEPPVIKGVKDQTIYIGGKVSYKKDITVTDNSGETIPLTVDNSKVNPKKEGNYDVIYSAKDSSGNETTVKAVFTVAKQPDHYVEPEEVDRVADEILAEILTDGMTKKEKAKTIYDWIRANVRYENHSDKSDWVQAAYRAMTKKTGDCFNYYAVAQELLTRAGIDNMKVQKLDGYKSKHYWNLVNLGDGWYHYDTTPRRAGGYFFLWTDAKLKEYSDKHDNSHIFDHSKYPATPLK